MLGWVATVEADTVSEGKLGAVEVEKVEVCCCVAVG